MSGAVDWEIEEVFPEVVSRFAASDDVVEEVADEILSWLEDCWETSRLPDEHDLVGVHRRLTASFGVGHRPTFEERAAGALLMVAADLDALACEMVLVSAGRDDLPVRSTRYRRAVLAMGLPLRDRLLGDLALDLVAEAHEAIQDASILGPVPPEMFDSVREVVEIVRSMATPRSDEALVMIEAALVAGHCMLGEWEASYRIADRSLRRVIPSNKVGSVGLAESFQIFGSLGVRAAIGADRFDEAVTLAERAAKAVHRLGLDIPADIHLALIEARMQLDPEGAYRLASDLLRGRLERGSPHDDDVLRMAFRLIIAGCLSEQPAVVDLIQYWRAVAAEAPPSAGSLEILESLEMLDENDDPVGFEMPELQVPDHLGDLEE